MRPIHNVVSGVQGLLWTPKKGGRFRLTANRSGRLRPEPVTRSQPYGCSSTIAGALADPQGLLWTAAAFLIVIFAYGAIA